MHKELVLSAFKKARKEVKEATGVNMSVTGIAKRISDYMMDECHFQYHEKSLRNKYNLALKDEQDVELKSSVANCLCCYLGYENYAEFIMKNSIPLASPEIVENIIIEEEYPPKKEPSIGEKLKIVIQKNKVTLIFCSLIFLLYFGLYMVNRQQWMVWDTDRYVEVQFDVEKYGLSNLKLYKHERIKKFREVKPDCNYLFFKSDGSENLWYQKATNGEVTFFTSFGLHPETGKTLKKITPYMIRKYICETY
ncbi:hypothetical protein H2O64_12460 [Kordia sp. YSTF-M3]|uniref:Uncharacterized protein n=1 Tax=Kordia aestuariivivens TaxID=2759037 RepID=A0ABR7QAV6_9FLAO|nr:hypothetical protein [Kordia aestuariivivens]MBC8755481.1 hypothetical protein [Kordia aestuariivivens]